MNDSGARSHSPLRVRSLRGMITPGRAGPNDERVATPSKYLVLLRLRAAHAQVWFDFKLIFFIKGFNLQHFLPQHDLPYFFFLFTYNYIFRRIHSYTVKIPFYTSLVNITSVYRSFGPFCSLSSCTRDHPQPIYPFGRGWGGPILGLFRRSSWKFYSRFHGQVGYFCRV